MAGDRTEALLVARDELEDARRRKDEARDAHRHARRDAERARAAAEQALVDAALDPATDLPSIRAKAQAALTLMGGERAAARLVTDAEHMRPGERLALAVALDVFQLRDAS